MNSDPTLLASYKNGDKEAFLTLYNKHSGPLKKFLQGGFSFSSQGRICRFRGVDPSMDADSFVQETFARAFIDTTRRNYDGARPFQTYLFSIAKNLVLRECHRRDRVVNVEQVEEATQSSVQYPFSSRENYGQSPEIQLQNLQLRNLTYQFIEALNDEERSFFSLRFSYQNTQEGTALKMNTTRARIKLLEKNIRKRFLDMLRKNGYLVEHSLKPRWRRKAQVSDIAA